MNKELTQTRDNNKEPQPKRTARVVLVDSDLAIFQFIYQFRLLRREHLSLLTGRPAKRLHRRILKLIQSHHLTRINLFRQKHIYGLGRAAAPVLVEKGVADPELLLQRSRIHELRELFLKHEMMIVDLHVILELATRQNSVRLISWKEGRGLYDSVTITDPAGIKKLSIRPDAFLTLEDRSRPAGGNQAHFFLEADRSSENHKQFRDKIRGYWHYLEHGLHGQKFGIRNFRVLTVTLTEERAKNLCALANSLLPERARKYFFFTSLKKFGLENPSPILEAVHLSPRNAHLRYPLVSPGRGSQVGVT